MVEKIQAQKKPLTEKVQGQLSNAKIPKRIDNLIETRIKSLKFQKAIGD